MSSKKDKWPIHLQITNKDELKKLMVNAGDTKKDFCELIAAVYFESRLHTYGFGIDDLVENIIKKLQHVIHHHHNTQFLLKLKRKSPIPSKMVMMLLWFLITLK